MKKPLYEIVQDLIFNSTEEEIDDIIRKDGKDPDEILARGEKAIQTALKRFRDSSYMFPLIPYWLLLQ